MASTDLDRLVTSAALTKRPGRLFIDYLRNGRGTTAIGAYSPRVRPGFPVAHPVTWEQVESGIRLDALSLDVPSRQRPSASARSRNGSKREVLTSP